MAKRFIFNDLITDSFVFNDLTTSFIHLLGDFPLLSIILQLRFSKITFVSLCFHIPSNFNILSDGLREAKNDRNKIHERKNYEVGHIRPSLIVSAT
jgi:hypothetical protein